MRANPSWLFPLLPLVFAVSTACVAAPGTPPGQEVPLPPVGQRSVSLHVLLAAIGNEQPVFDRFVVDLARRLDALEVASVTTASASGQVGRKLDTPDDVYAAIRELHAGRSGGCFVYLTGHGTPDGLSLPLGAGSAPAPRRRYAALRVPRMEAALRDGCGDSPTVVVLSACYSGVYLRPSMKDPNRIVLTAAAADRTSFGCGNDETHTYFDGCFLRSLDAAATWRQLAARTSACVARLERRLLPGERQSKPQAWFGQHVRDMLLPSRRQRR